MELLNQNIFQVIGVSGAHYMLVSFEYSELPWFETIFSKNQVEKAPNIRQSYQLFVSASLIHEIYSSDIKLEK